MLGYDRSKKRAVVIAFDSTLCVMAAWIAFSLRVGALDFPLQPFLLFAASAVVIFIPIYFRAGVYAAIFRFAGVGTVRDLAVATFFYTVPLVLIYMVYGVQGVPRTIALLHPIIFLGLTSFSRILMRQLLSELHIDPRMQGSARRALIYGAGSAGLQLALSLRHTREVSVCGFVDDDARLHGQRLEGLTVVHSDILEATIEDQAIDAVLVALPNAGRKRRREIIERLQPLAVKVKILPQVEHIVDGRVTIEDLREIQIEDLLGRDSVTPNEILLRKAIVGKCVLVTGAGGSIGSELCRQIAALGPRRLVLAEMSEHALYEIESELGKPCENAGVALEAELVSLVDPGSTKRVFGRWRPETVFHAAAYKHVPLVEKNILSGLRNNIIGTLNAVRAADAFSVERFILISTDKAVRPSNVMGASKRVCELILQAFAKANSNTCFAMVRFGNVLGSSGSVVPRFLQQIREGGPVTLTDFQITRFFMTIPEAAQLVIQASGLAEGGEVYLLDMGESIRIVELARTMIELSGLSVRDETNPAGDIEIVEVGLRPGEKLYEELLIDAQAEKTLHPRIFRARENSITKTEIESHLSQLACAVEEGNRAQALQVLHSLVPEYVAGAEARAVAAALP